MEGGEGGGVDMTWSVLNDGIDRYANRAKSIKNKPKINEDPKDAMIREFKEEIERLRKMLEAQGPGGGGGGLHLPPPSNPKGVSAGLVDEVIPPEEASARVTDDVKPEAMDFAALVESECMICVCVGYGLDMSCR